MISRTFSSISSNLCLLSSNGSYQSKLKFACFTWIKICCTPSSVSVKLSFFLLLSGTSFLTSQTGSGNQDGGRRSTRSQFIDPIAESLKF